MFARIRNATLTRVVAGFLITSAGVCTVRYLNDTPQVHKSEERKKSRKKSKKKSKKKQQ
jgi:hypothetical protein